MKNLTRHLDPRNTPQSEPLPGSAQVPNNAGGYSFAADPWTRLDRFLILGSEGGTYYATERALTLLNAGAVAHCLELDGTRAVATIAEISRSGRAHRNTPAIFSLAMALKTGDLCTRRAARDAVPVVCRTASHLFELATAVKVFGGWGRLTQSAFASWYTQRTADQVAYQAVKYQQRNGWTGRDLLRKAHVQPPTPEHDVVFKWMTRGWTAADLEAAGAPEILVAFERAKRAESAGTIVQLIERAGLPREAIPSRFLNDARVWEALLDNQGRGMPTTALFRNLGKLSSIGVLTSTGPWVERVVSMLTDAERLRRGRIHPLTALNALLTYRRGAGVRGSNRWPVVKAVVDALDDAFYTAFGHIRPSGKRTMLALDVSGSMGCGRLAGLQALTPREGSAAMAMVTARTEAQYAMFGFSTRFVELDITPRQRLDDVIRSVSSVPMGGTDCALPMVHARKRRIPIDVFVVYTDSETWYGKVHPTVALKQYRDAMGIDAKLAVVGMVSNEFTIADPDDASMLDVVGFDRNAPEVLSDFARSGA